jgi:hypothetical protein
MSFDFFQLPSNSFCICLSFGKLVARLTVAGLILNLRATSAQLIISLRTNPGSGLKKEK